MVNGDACRLSILPALLDKTSPTSRGANELASNESFKIHRWAAFYDPPRPRDAKRNKDFGREQPPPIGEEDERMDGGTDRLADGLLP